MSTLCLLLAVSTLALLGGSSAAGADADEPAWQANARGLCQGPLCSLQLRVSIGKTLDLVTPGGSLDTGWNTLGPADIPLGCIGLPNTLSVTAVERTGDWSHSQAVVTFEDSTKLTLFASTLSPGIVVETSASHLRLFAGQHERMATWDDRGKMRIHGHMNGNLAVTNTITPAWIAVPQGHRLEVIATDKAIPLPPPDQPWLLAWWGRASHFIATGWPLVGHGTHPDAYLADCPLLILFDQPPTAITAVREGGVDFTFAEPGRRLILLPLGGGQAWPADEAAGWADRLPDAIFDRCRRLAASSWQYPLSVRERFRYDAASDRRSLTRPSRSSASGPVPTRPRRCRLWLPSRCAAACRSRSARRRPSFPFPRRTAPCSSPVARGPSPGPSTISASTLTRQK